MDNSTSPTVAESLPDSVVLSDSVSDPKGMMDPNSKTETEDLEDRKPAAVERPNDKERDSNDSPDGNDNDDVVDDDHGDHDDADDSDSHVDDNSDDSISFDDQSESNENPEGLSEYERLREERIRRNQQYLAKLGLEETLPKKLPGNKRKRSASHNNTPEVRRRSSLGRASKQKPIQYNVDEATSIRKLMGTNDSKLPKESKPKNSAVSSSKKPRVPLEVYKEFNRLARQRKEATRKLHKYRKSAVKHLQYWERRLQKYRARLVESAEQHRLRTQYTEERRQLGGKTKLECWQELEKRSNELWATIVEFDKGEAMRKKAQEEQRVQREIRQRQIELDRKLELVDALDRFPTAFQESSDILNNLLLQRAPKDPPPPRRSKRVILEEEEVSATAANDDINAMDIRFRPSPSILDKLRAAMVRHKQQSTTRNTSEDAVTMESNLHEKPPDIDGWISPPFAESLDRLWLSREQPSEDMASTPPQIGQLLLYYPGAHKSFLEAHPDVWGNENRTRTPLWEQAAKIRNFCREHKNAMTVTYNDDSKEGNRSITPTRTIEKTNQSSIKQEMSGVNAQRPTRRRAERAFEAVDKRNPNICIESIKIDRNGSQPITHSSSRLQKQITQNQESRLQEYSPETSSNHFESLTSSKVSNLDGRSSSRRSESFGRSHSISRSSIRRRGDMSRNMSSSLQHAEAKSYSAISELGVTLLDLQNDKDTEHDQSTSTQVISIEELDKGSTLEPITRWWTDEWIQGIDSNYGQYPILCRVKQTHAEFPYDPNLEFRKVDKDGNVTWIIKEHKPSGSKRQDDNASQMCLRLVLQPLTQILPPECEEHTEVSKKDSKLSLPPEFSVITFPSKDATPFLVPFSWAFAKSHSISIGDSVLSRWSDRMDNESIKGKVSSFVTMGSGYGSFRLDDKLPSIQYFVEKFSTGSPKEIEELLSIPGSTSSELFTLPVEDAALLIDFLTLYLTKSTNQEVGIIMDPPLGNCVFLDFIRSTFPLYSGVGIRREVFHRRMTFTAGWMLRKTKKNKDGFPEQVSSLLAESLRQGVPNRLENSLRIKLRIALQDFLDNHPEASTFIELVTEDVAPSYYCAVPVGMHFDRILARLSTCSRNDYCYYTSFESVLADTEAVLDNCLLYNSPESPLATVASNLIPALKTQLENVYVKHENEHDIKNLHENERVGSASQDLSTRIDLGESSFLKGLNSPYRGPLDRSKLQTLTPDNCWKDVLLRKNKNTHAPGEEHWWIPQSGDRVMYSRILHSEFVRRKQQYLYAFQLNLPTFAQKVDSNAAITPEFVEARWLHARIVSVQATFPCEIEHYKENISHVPTPVMAIGLHFLYEWADVVVTVFWQQETSSFLRPLWINEIPSSEVIEKEGLLLDFANDAIESEFPYGIDSESSRRILNCFDVLKHRCLNGVNPDHVNPKLNLDSANQNGTITLSSTRTRNLSSFEELLSPDINRSEEIHVSTRGIRRTDDDDALRCLSETFYLPPWALDTLEEDPKKRKMSNYDSMMPFPNLCLELVRLRLKHGYYRQVAGILGDLQEAYVTSTLFVLSGFASRRKNRLSIQKITKCLCTASLSSEGTYYSREELSDEESGLISRLENARKLYTMAILAVKDCQHVENILGLNVKSSRMEAKEPIASEDDASSEMSAAAERIRYLLAAAGREPCLNSFNDLGLMKIKILVNDQVIRSKNGNASAIESFIILGHNQYSSNDALARALLRRPGRRAPCIRCQVYGFTFYTCRVLRCHSNPDFDFVANWREVGGIEGLLAPFKAASSVPIAGCDPHLSHFQDPMAVDKNSILEDPTMELEKARKAVQTSTFLVGQADALASERFKLSTKFIQAAFPVDPDDGHYIWCTICGLSGDVLCCDGCSNVVHPKCIGLSTIPEDDWFCDACSIKRKSSDQTNPPSRSADHSSPIELPNSLGSHHVHSPSAKAKPVPLITDDEYDEQVELLAKLVDELDRRRYPNGKPQKNAQITVGTIFYKTFSKFGRFKGKVVSTPTESHPYCSVEYEDGDVEELEPAELLSLLQEPEDVVAEDSMAKLQCHSSDSDGGHKGKRHRGRRDVAVASTLGDTVEVPRKRGRPRKYPLQSVAVDVSPNSLPRHTSTCQGAFPEAPKILALKGKEKRGRPRKSTRDDENKKNCLSSTESSLPVPTIHQRIRPSFRSSRGNSSTAPSGQVAEGVKKRGRPRKAT